MTLVRRAHRFRLAAAVGVLAALGACAEDGPDAAEEAESALAAVVAERLDVGVPHVGVQCPEDLDVEAGTEFSCVVTVGDATPVDLALAVEADGTVELRRAVVPTQAAEEYLVAELAGPAESPVVADCGDAPLLVADIGDELRCEVVRTADGAVHPVVVTVLALDGTVRYRVEAPATVPGSTGSTGTTSPP